MIYVEYSLCYKAAMRRRSALVALLAVVAHALAPLLANAAPGAAVDHIQLCTAQGIVTVEVDSGGVPAGSPLAAGHCSVCAFQNGIAPCVAVARIAQTIASVAVPAAEQPQPRFSFTYSARPRAPPHHS